MPHLPNAEIAQLVEPYISLFSKPLWSIKLSVGSSPTFRTTHRNVPPNRKALTKVGAFWLKNFAAP